MHSKNISVMILAAGYGSRLRPITKKIPKPLVKVAGITLLQNTLDQVLSLNCKEIIINTHYQHKMIYDALGSKMGNELHALSIKTQIP